MATFRVELYDGDVLLDIVHLREHECTTGSLQHRADFSIARNGIAYSGNFALTVKNSKNDDDAKERAARAIAAKAAKESARQEKAANNARKNGVRVLTDAEYQALVKQGIKFVQG